MNTTSGLARPPVSITARRSPNRPDPRPTMIDRLYLTGVAVKGLDGLLELILGLALFVVPSLPHAVLETAAGRATQSGLPLSQFVGTYLENLDGTLLRWGSGLLIAYLVAHGVIKLLLVVCLLLRLHRVYPAALVVLGGFLAYELYLFCTGPSVSLGLLSVLDAAIIYLVFREYRELTSRASGARA
jgi:uncharacterized membrane protein